MRRRAWWILGTLVGAAILNAAVALACAAGTGAALFDPQLTARVRRRHFEAAEASDAGTDSEGWIESAYRAAGLDVVITRPPAGPVIRSHRCGLPVRALEGVALEVPGTPGPVGHRWAVEAGGELNLESRTGPRISRPVGRLMPLRPMWPGFALNTLIYAAAAALAAALWRTSTRALRRLRGRCPRCAYDLRAEPGGGCPECGWRRPRRVDA